MCSDAAAFMIGHALVVDGRPDGAKDALAGPDVSPATVWLGQIRHWLN
jgi:hypothetical protein